LILIIFKDFLEIHSKVYILELKFGIFKYLKNKKFKKKENFYQGYDQMKANF